MNQDIFSKWLINGFPDYCFGSDKHLYRMPFKSGRNYFGLRRLKKQNPNRWKIASKWWSQNQLESKIYLNPNPEVIVKNQNMPF